MIWGEGLTSRFRLNHVVCSKDEPAIVPMASTILWVTSCGIMVLELNVKKNVCKRNSWHQVKPCKHYKKNIVLLMEARVESEWNVTCSSRWSFLLSRVGFFRINSFNTLKKTFKLISNTYCNHICDYLLFLFLTSAANAIFMANLECRNV